MAEKNRTKMPREERAKQFAPFDALKGLQNALRIKEYQHERKQKGDIQEEQANKISQALLNLESGDVVNATYFRDGHIHSLSGAARLDIEKRQICVSRAKIDLDELTDLEICHHRNSEGEEK